jgi:hypothetical protein
MNNRRPMVSQVCVRPPNCQNTVVSSAWLLVKSSEGILSGLTGVAQKKGRAEAAPAGSKSVVDAFVPLLLYHIL